MKRRAAERFKGRQGGRFAEEGAGRHAADIHATRLRELDKGPEKGTWPAESLAEWSRIAAAATARPDGVSPSPTEQLALEVAAAKAAGWPLPKRKTIR